MNSDPLKDFLQQNRPTPLQTPDPALSTRIWAKIQSESQKTQNLRWASALSIPIFTLMLGIWTSHQSSVSMPPQAKSEVTAVSQDLAYDFAEEEENLGDFENFASLGL